MIKKGIDVSKWQGIIDWNKVKNSGIEFAIIRIGFGKYINQKDTCFERNYREARNNCIPIGVYHYSYATSVEEAKEEAKCVVRWLNGRKLDLPVYFDIEDKSQSSLNKNILNSMCEAFCNIIEKSGSWFSYNGEKLGQGKENVKLLLKQNTILRDELEKKIREYYSIDTEKEN